MATNKSVISLVVSPSNLSLRITAILIHIVEKLGLRDDDQVIWDLDKVENVWVQK